MFVRNAKVDTQSEIVRSKGGDVQAPSITMLNVTKTYANVVFFLGNVSFEIKEFDISTPVHVPELLKLIEGYPDYEFIAKGFMQGFALGVRENPLLMMSKKLGNVPNKHMLEKFQGELDSGRIIGPFKDPPFTDLMVSPIYVIPKPNTTKWRMIFNLSSPKGASVNDNIPDVKRCVAYTDVRSVVSHIVSLHNTNEVFMAKLDISDAYRLVPIAKSDWKYLGIHLDSGYYIDRRLPMGAGSSCQIFQRISDMLQWLFVKIQNCHCRVFNYLDDFLIVAVGQEACNTALETIMAVSKVVGIPMAPHKIERATQAITFLGIGIDAKDCSLYIPEEKREKTLAQLNSFLNRKKARVLDWQKLLGKLCHLSQVVVAGSVFLSSVYGSLKGVLSTQQHLFRTISAETRGDLAVWQHFLTDTIPGKRFSYMVGGTPTYTIFTDASGSTGFGATMDEQWFCGTWPDTFWSSLNIAVLELYPVLISLNIWLSGISNSIVAIRTDNKALVPVLTRLYCKDATIRKLLRPIALLSMKNNLLIIATHIEGKKNIKADLLSRNKLFEFRERFPEMADAQTEVPSHLLPMKIKNKYW